MGLDGFVSDTDRGASESHMGHIWVTSGSHGLCWIQIGLDGFVWNTDSGASRGHMINTSAVTPCGHTVWTLFYLY